MVTSIVQKDKQQEIDTDSRKILTVLALIILFIVSLTILQDLLESSRSGYAFHFSESLLFKTFWFLFIPILTVLSNRLKIENLGHFSKFLPFIILPIVIHLLLVPIIATVFSILFFEGRYDLYKFFSYTLAHDFYKLVTIYASFVLGYGYFQIPSKSKQLAKKDVLNRVVINNGQNNTIISSEDILQITAATPYIYIHIENKKYLHSATLKSMYGQLDDRVFIRVHKSTIVNIQKVKSFKSRLNGDYDIQLVDSEIIRLSRTYVPEFKKRFLTTHQDSL